MRNITILLSTVLLWLNAYGVRHIDPSVDASNPDAIGFRKAWDAVGCMVANDPSVRFGNLVAVGPNLILTAAHLATDDDLIGRVVDFGGATNWVVRSTRRNAVGLDIVLLTVSGPPLPYVNVARSLPPLEKLVLVGRGNGTGLIEKNGRGTAIFCGSPGKRIGTVEKWSVSECTLSMTLAQGSDSYGSAPCYGDSGGGIFIRTGNTVSLAGIMSQLGPIYIGESAPIGTMSSCILSTYTELSSDTPIQISPITPSKPADPVPPSSSNGSISTAKIDQQMRDLYQLLSRFFQTNSGGLTK